MAKIFDFESAKSDSDKMVLTIRFQTASNEAKTGMAGWVHTMASRYNVPGKMLDVGAVKAKEFEAYVASLISDVVANKDVLLGKDFVIDKKMLSLTGNTPFANAVKRAKGCMEIGGDLSDLDTISKCEKYVRDFNKAKASGEAAAKLREQAIAMAKSEGLEEGTPEFEARVKGLVGGPMGVSAGSGGNTDDDTGTGPVLDLWDDVGKQYAILLREIAKLKGEDDALMQADFYIKKLKNIRDTAISQAGVATGLIKEEGEQQVA